MFFTSNFHTVKNFQGSGDDSFMVSFTNDCTTLLKALLKQINIDKSLVKVLHNIYIITLSIFVIRPSIFA